MIAAVALAFKTYLVLVLPPTSDVYYYDEQAAGLIIRGINPYGHLFTGVPQALATPGAANVFAYLPFTAIFAIPFYLLGDVRFAAVASDLIIGLSLFQFSRKWSFPVAAVFLLFPSTYYLNDAVFAAAFVALSLALESRAKDLLASVTLGIALASSLLVWLTVPFFALRYWRKKRTSLLLVAVAIGAVIVLPFLLPNPSEFIHDVLFFQLDRQAPPLFFPGGPFGFTLNPSLSGLAVSLTGQAAPPSLRGVIVLVALALLMLRTPKGTARPPEEPGRLIPESPGLLRCALFVTVAVLVIPSVFFFAYLEFPAVLFLAWLAAR